MAIPKNTQGALADASRLRFLTGWYIQPRHRSRQPYCRWKADPDLLQTQAEENGVVTLYAGWQENEYPVTYDLGT